jgi:hypothetical protein
VVSERSDNPPSNGKLMVDCPIIGRGFDKADCRCAPNPPYATMMFLEDKCRVVGGIANNQKGSTE